MFPNDARFLVVDDFTTMRKIIKKVLLELGYSNIEEADDGKTALPMIEMAHTVGKPYDLIICDWNMPGMLGIDLLKACKANPNLKPTPFLLVTAESEQRHILEAAKAGVSDYVVKPFNSVTLKAKLERIYAKHEAKKAQAS